jgi:hypothetical protein
MPNGPNGIRFRRVKCDEGKPSCARCCKYGISCDGYEAVFKPLKAYGAGMREIRPLVPTGRLVPRRDTTIPSLAIKFPLRDEREYQYFLYFQEETSRDLSSCFDTSLWSHVVLQASQGEPFLCQLIVSIGALSRAANVQTTSYDTALPHRHATQSEYSTHLQYARIQYGRALAGIQRSLDKKQSARVALIAAVLIYCFEHLNGEVDSAIRHMESALQLMRQQLLRKSRFKFLNDISPIPEFDGAIIAAFVQIDNAILSRLDGTVRPAILDVNYPEDEVPTRFRDIAEARKYLEMLQFKVLPKVMYDFMTLYKPGSLDEASRKMYTALSAQLRQWRVAFAPLSARCVSGSLIFVATLRIQALSFHFAARRILQKELKSSDSFIADSRELIDLSKLVIADSGFRRAFVFDCGIIPGLFIVVAAAVDMGTRKEALEVLRSTVPRREGVWDSTALVQIGENLLRGTGVTNDPLLVLDNT